MTGDHRRPGPCPHLRRRRRQAPARLTRLVEAVGELVQDPQHRAVRGPTTRAEDLHLAGHRLHIRQARRTGRQARTRCPPGPAPIPGRTPTTRWSAPSRSPSSRGSTTQQHRWTARPWRACVALRAWRTRNAWRPRAPCGRVTAKRRGGCACGSSTQVVPKSLGPRSASQNRLPQRVPVSESGAPDKGGRAGGCPPGSWRGRGPTHSRGGSPADHRGGRKQASSTPRPSTGCAEAAGDQV